MLTLFHQLIWLTVIIIWIIQANEGETAVDLYVETIDYVYYITVYGGYGAMWLLVLLSTFILPLANVNTGYPFGTSGQGFGLVFAYMLIVGINLFVQIFFDKPIHKWQAINTKLMEKKKKNEAEKARRKELGLPEDPNEKVEYDDGERKEGTWEQTDTTSATTTADRETDEMNETGARVREEAEDLTEDDNTGEWDDGTDNESPEETIDPWGETNFVFDWNSYIKGGAGKVMEEIETSEF